MIIKQASTYNRTFLMVQSSDHITGLTGAAPVVRLSKNGAAPVTATGSPATEVNAANFPGLYSILLSAPDTNTVGDLAVHCTAASGDPTDFIDQVQSQWFPDLQLAPSGRVLIATNVQQNAPLNGFAFVMTSNTTHAPLPGLGTGVAAQRSLGGAGFSPCANTPTELSNGVYVINLAATDTNAPTVLLRFTNAAADDLDILITTQP